MLLTRKLPNKLYAFDKGFEIITNARFWINVSVEYEKLEGNPYAQTELLLGCIKDRDFFERIADKYKKRLFQRICVFFKCDIFKSNDRKPEKSEEKNEEKLYDFEKDSGDIISAFQEAYNIDLTKELDYMHWWRFMALFNYLPSSVHFVSYTVRYRKLKRNDTEYKNLKDDAKKAVDKIKESVSLEEDSFYEDIYNEDFEESIFEKVERIKKEEIKN